MFQFKQFAVDQTGCAMKINTDGVLLGAMAIAHSPKHILDIGTGTGVMALMLAQRFIDAHIDAVEIDYQAWATAARNFAASEFAERLRAYHSGFQEFLNIDPDGRYDLIVSNPPFYINSLKPPGVERSKAKHADEQFFVQLISKAYGCLSDDGLLWLVLPIETSGLVQKLAAENGLYIHHITNIRSYPGSVPHRHIISFSKKIPDIKRKDFIIYDRPKQYSQQYSKLLQPFFTIF